MVVDCIVNVNEIVYQVAEKMLTISLGSVNRISQELL